MGQSLVDPPTGGGGSGSHRDSSGPDGVAVDHTPNGDVPRPPFGYHQLRRICRERGVLFEDPEFYLGAKLSLHGRQVSATSLVWMRPGEICTRPKFISSNASRFDIEQGELGDGCLLAAVSCLTVTPAFLERVMPPDQTFGPGYCGIFRFRFWKFGDWTEVVVDDRLPTCKGRLLSMRSSDPTEFWPALLEKAYAKFCGSYGSLHGGRTFQTLQDLTGGIAQRFRIAEHDPHVMFQTVNSSVIRSTLLAASILMDHRAPVRLRNGLLTQHAYSITGLARVRTRTGEVPLIRLRNPWGKGEWNGPWSDRSWEWDSLPERDQELLSVRVRNDGEFWMSFEDFLRNFTYVDLLHIGPDDWMLESAMHSRRPWRAVLARRRWRVGFNAGGGLHCKETTAMNPQFRIHIAKNGTKKCHLVVSVMQQYSISSTNGEAGKKPTLLPIGFAVYEVPANTVRLSTQFVHAHMALDVAVNSPSREVAMFFALPAGDFAIIPFTQSPNCETRFLLRIFTDEVSNIWEVNEENLLCREITMSYSGDLLSPQTGSPMLIKLMNKLPPEIDALLLQKILRAYWRTMHLLCEKPSLELCRNLIMLRDPTINGKLNRTELPGMLYTLQCWKSLFMKFDNSKSRTSSFNFRTLLWEAGITVSNKVLECLVLRFAKNSVLTSEAFLIALVKLYLAHERFISVEKKMKENAFSLEEMILLTVYS